jgi:hypothetical protein
MHSDMHVSLKGTGTGLLSHWVPLAVFIFATLPPPPLALFRRCPVQNPNSETKRKDGWKDIFLESQRF